MTNVYIWGILRLREGVLVIMDKMVFLEEEVASIEDLAIDGVKRHENSILANVPKGLSEKGVLATRLFMYFMDKECVSEWTGKKTFMNVEESYIMSGVYPENHLGRVYQNVERTVTIRNRDGSEMEDVVFDYKVVDKKEDMRIRSEALRYWQQNGLEMFFDQVAVEKMGGINPEKLIRYNIVEKSLTDGDEQLQYTKLAIDILGMKVKEKKEIINLRKSGGQEIIKSVSERKGAGFLSDGDDEE